MKSCGVGNGGFVKVGRGRCMRKLVCFSMMMFTQAFLFGLPASAQDTRDLLRGVVGLVEKPFFESIDDQVRVKVFSSISKEIKKDFIAKLAELDEIHILFTRHIADSNNLESVNYDVVIFLINDWSDLEYAPKLEDFPDLVGKVVKDAAEEEFAVKMVLRIRENGQPKLFLFFPLNEFSGDVVGCITQYSYNVMTMPIVNDKAYSSAIDRCFKRSEIRG